MVGEFSFLSRLWKSVERRRGGEQSMVKSHGAAGGGTGALPSPSASALVSTPARGITVRAQIQQLALVEKYVLL